MTLPKKLTYLVRGRANHLALSIYTLNIKLSSDNNTYTTMFRDIMEIHQRAMQIRREKELREIKESINRNKHPLPVVTRTAAIQHATYLLKSTYSDGNRMFEDREVANLSKLPLHEVASLNTRLAKQDKETRRFALTSIFLFIIELN
jgi:hypothetical protein